jgi:hypothetical protein
MQTPGIADQAEQSGRPRYRENDAFSVGYRAQKFIQTECRTAGCWFVVLVARPVHRRIVHAILMEEYSNEVYVYR